jgi:hypothetical protein
VARSHRETTRCGIGVKITKATIHFDLDSSILLVDSTGLVIAGLSNAKHTAGGHSWQAQNPFHPAAASSLKFSLLDTSQPSRRCHNFQGQETALTFLNQLQCQYRQNGQRTSLSLN